MNVLAFDFNNILTDVIEELTRRGHTILPLDGKASTWKKADVVIVWNETEGGGWRDWIKKVQKAGKRVILIQHGRRGTSRIYPPFNDELVSDVVCVWGENDVKRLTSCGVPREKIFVTGTPVTHTTKPRKTHAGKNVVFSPEHWDTDVMENAIVAGALRRIPDVKIITKILENEHRPHEYDNPIASNRLQPGHLDVCAEVLSIADAVVSISEGTFELLAQSLGIPVIIADIWVPKACLGDERHKLYQREYSNACERVKDLYKLGDVVKKHLKNPDLLKREREEICILDGGTNIENPVEEIIKVIEYE